VADTKISGLPVATLPLTGSEKLVLVQGGVSKEAAVNDVTTLVSGQNQHSRLFFEVTTASASDLVGSSDPWPPDNSFSVPVPSWASRAIVLTTIGGCYAVTSGLNHIVQLSFGTLLQPSQRIRWQPHVSGGSIVSGAVVGADSAVDAGSRQTILRTTQFNVTAFRGLTKSLRTVGSRVSGTGAIRIDGGIESFMTMDCQFFPV
jgi:hypothetical protein